METRMELDMTKQLHRRNIIQSYALEEENINISITGYRNRAHVNGKSIP
jgi:hypothetical protein